MTAIFNLCNKLIEKEKTEGLLDKLNVYLSCDRLTMDEYTELVALLSKEDKE